MIVLLYLALHLIFLAHSQCNTTHSQSLLLSLSINGNQIKKIGYDKYVTIVESSVHAIVPSGTTRVGINTFGGSTDQPHHTIATATKLSMGPTTWPTVQSTIRNLSSEHFEANWGNSVNGAISKALTTSWNGQKYHVVFSSGMPLANGFEEDTNPINFEDPCSKSITAKQNNIQQYVVLIGVEGIHYVKEYFTCMVEDPDRDIIEINPSDTAEGIAKLHSRVCKPNGIDIKITEVNPTDSIFRPFIEVLNRGAPASISVCWATNACSAANTVDTGTYYVGFGSGNGFIEHNAGTVEESLGINSAGATGWTARAQVNGSDVAHVTHGSDVYWQTLLPSSSYELRGVGYNNRYGANWRMSCYPNQGGTPGYTPVDCMELDDSCNQKDCDINGAASLGCYGHSMSLCHCSSSQTYLEDIRTCIKVPEVHGECRAYVIPDDITHKDFMYFTWNRVEWDGDVSYDLLYPSTHGIAAWNTGGVAAASRNDVYSGIMKGAVPPNITVIVEYRSVIRGITVSTDTDLTCTVQTLAPVIQPTSSPTVAPTPPPIETTHAPNTSGVFLYSICGRVLGTVPRCECFEEPRSCCMNSDCQNIYKAISLEPRDQTNGLSQPITITKYGGSARTEVRYTIRAYGVIDRSAFENLTIWTDRDALTTRNKLNIHVEPPGNNVMSSGMIVIDDGREYGELWLDISASRLDPHASSYEECHSEGLAFELVVDACVSEGSTVCDALYPHTLWIMVYRSYLLCTESIDDSKGDDDICWICWVLPVLLVSVICLACLVYRFWWKQRVMANSVANLQDALDQQTTCNQDGHYSDF
eukprot:66615_1